jgi:hypothetical protein
MAKKKETGRKRRFGPGRNRLLQAKETRGRGKTSLWQVYSGRLNRDLYPPSGLEFMHICALEGDENISNYVPWPKEDHVTSNGEVLTTKFDAHVTLRSGRPQMREVSESDEESDPRKIAQHETQLLTLAGRELDYVRITRAMLQDQMILIRNWWDALPRLKSAHGLVLEPYRKELMRRAEFEGRINFEALLQDTDPALAGNYQAAIFQCIQAGVLRSNLNSEPLSASSLVWPRNA